MRQQLISIQYVNLIVSLCVVISCLFHFSRSFFHLIYTISFYIPIPFRYISLHTYFADVMLLMPVTLFKIITISHKMYNKPEFSSLCIYLTVTSASPPYLLAPPPRPPPRDRPVTSPWPGSRTARRVWRRTSRPTPTSPSPCSWRTCSRSRSTRR